jgi:hypothetical protein
MNLKYYERQYRRAIKRLRAGRPEASCLVMSPQDHGLWKKKRIVTDPLLEKIVRVQRRLASDVGCAFFDSVAAMGGPGAAGRGYRAKPRLFYRDLTHLTPAGDRILGDQLYKALMKAFAEWLRG